MEHSWVGQGHFDIFGGLSAFSLKYSRTGFGGWSGLGHYANIFDVHEIFANIVVRNLEKCFDILGTPDTIIY